MAGKATDGEHCPQFRRHQYQYQVVLVTCASSTSLSLRHNPRTMMTMMPKAAYPPPPPPLPPPPPRCLESLNQNLTGSSHRRIHRGGRWVQDVAHFLFLFTISRFPVIKCPPCPALPCPLHRTALPYPAFHCHDLPYAALHCTALCCTEPHCHALPCTTLHCTAG